MKKISKGNDIGYGLGDIEKLGLGKNFARRCGGGGGKGKRGKITRKQGERNGGKRGWRVNQGCDCMNWEARLRREKKGHYHRNPNRGIFNNLVERGELYYCESVGASREIFEGKKLKKWSRQEQRDKCVRGTRPKEVGGKTGKGMESYESGSP